MKYTWLFIIPPITIAIIIFVAWYRYRLHSHDRDLRRVAVIAHTSTIKKLPAYRKAVKRYRILMIFAVLSFLVSLFSFTATAARPTERIEIDTANINRDVVLCLDVSPSMSSYQTKLLKFFNDVVDGLNGQRIGLTIFDGNPANLIPLTDDYDAIIEITTEMSSNFEDYSAIPSVRKQSSSAIGDGVMGCISNLGNLDNTERSKSVIIATDNLPGEGETVDINQAARYAKRYGITFYGISIGFANGDADKLFENATTITGGSFYNINTYSSEDEVTGNLIEKILEQEAAKAIGAPEVTYSDAPDIWLLVSIASFALFLIFVWRLKL